jgi:hypothetical protein
MVRMVVGLAVALIGLGVAGLRYYMVSDMVGTATGSTESSGGMTSLFSNLASLTGDQPASGSEPAADGGIPMSPFAVAQQFSQIQAILEQEMAAAEQNGLGQFPAAVTTGPAVVEIPQPQGPARGAAPGSDPAAATTGPASAAQVVVIRPRQ